MRARLVVGKLGKVRRDKPLWPPPARAKSNMASSHVFAETEPHQKDPVAQIAGICMSRLSAFLRKLPDAWKQPRFSPLEGPPILLLHVPKTAGTSLRRMLQTSLGIDAVYPSDEDLRRRPGGLYPSETELLDRFASLPRHRILVGHFSASFAERLPLAHRRAIFLRDPIQRSLSALAHFHRTTGIAPHRLLDDRHFVARSIRNFQTNVLGGDYPNPTDCSMKTLHTAKKNLEALEFVGLTEHFHDSCLLFDHVFGTTISAALLKENVMRPNGTEYGELIPRIIPHIGIDVVLYSHAVSRFMSDTKQMQATSPRMQRTQRAAG